MAETELIIFYLVIKVAPKVVKVTTVWNCVVIAVMQTVMQVTASAPSPNCKITLSRTPILN
jgi:hypothetical protein